MPTSVYRQAEHPLTIEAGPVESVHIPEGGDAELELPENYDDDAYEGYEAMLQLQAEAAASESLALRLGSPRFERPSALSPFAEEEVDEASASPELEAPPPPADSGGASSSLAPVTERSASWRRQLAERSAADAQEEAPPPPAAARGGKRPVDGRRAAAARLGKQIAEKERQKEEAPLVVLRRALDQPLELLVLHEVLRERHPRQLLVTLVRGHAFVTECGQILRR